MRLAFSFTGHHSLSKKIRISDLLDQNILVSMDVTALYTNIPQEDGIAACKEAWDSRIIKNPPKEALIELLVLILKCNNFIFCDKHFLQVHLK
jgi:hypothetical protein